MLPHWHSDSNTGTMDLRKVFASALVLLLLAFGSSKGSYAGDVEALFKQLFPNQGNVCYTMARGKMQGGTSDRDWAKGLINLYTQECTDYKGSQGKSFYRKLNELLRNGQITTDSVLEKSANLLNTGLKKIGLKTFTSQSLYRGCHCKDGLAQKTSFAFRQFASTSKLAYKAFDASHFFVIKNAQGVEIKDFSAIPSENEVLLKSTAQFTAVEVITDKAMVKQKLKEVGAPNNEATTFVVLTQTNARKRRSVKNAAVSCDCSRYDDETSNVGTIRALPVTLVTTLIVQLLTVGALC